MKLFDKVAFTIDWLENTGFMEAASYRGEVIDIEDFGPSKLVTVRWAHGDVTRVIIDNLCLLKPSLEFCKC